MPVATYTEDYIRAENLLFSTGISSLTYAVANAIAAERERCALVAENFNEAGKPIGAAIRKPSRCEPSR